MKKIMLIIIFVLFVFSAWKIAGGWLFGREVLDFSGEKTVKVDENGHLFVLSARAANVDDLLGEEGIELGENDLIFPSGQTKLLPGMTVSISRAVPVFIEVDGETLEHHTLKDDVAGALSEAGVQLSHLDKVSPEKSTVIEKDLEIVVTRINIEQVTEKESVAFDVLKKEDEDLAWRKEKVEQAGENGQKEVLYEVTYKNGKQISKEELSSKITKEPIDKIVRIGTKIKFGKSHRGWATWYDQGPHPKLRARYPFEGDMFAASPWLPLGSYAKVTNKANGKAVIVRINDRGPFGDNRILDLNKPAFAKIASLGAGVIDVKVEEIKE